MQRVGNKQDWQLLKKRLPGWHEAFMASRIKEYTKLLSDETKLASARFWQLDKMIKEDRKKSGVIVELSPSDMDLMLLNLLREGAITESDLEGFIEELRLGQSVQLVREEGNPHDPDAVAVLYKNTKIGYVPAQYNGLFSTLLYYGHGDILEARIQMVSLETHPERQFRVVVKVTDARGDAGA